MAMAPSAARGWGMSGGTAMTGAFQVDASSARRPPPEMTTMAAPAKKASDAAWIVSSVSPDADTANTRLPASTNAGHSYDFTTATGTGSMGAATAATTSPAMPLPAHADDHHVLDGRQGREDRPSPGRAGPRRRTCSGSPAVSSNIPSVSSTTSAYRLRVEGRFDALGLRLGAEPLVLGVVDRLGLVDQHDRDVVGDPVAEPQARVVQRLLVGEVEQRPLVLGAGQDLEQLRVEHHGLSSTPSVGASTRARRGQRRGSRGTGRSRPTLVEVAGADQRQDLLGAGPSRPRGPPPRG